MAVSIILAIKVKHMWLLIAIQAGHVKAAPILQLKTTTPKAPIDFLAHIDTALKYQDVLDTILILFVLVVLISKLLNWCRNRKHANMTRLVLELTNGTDSVKLTIAKFNASLASLHFCFETNVNSITFTNVLCNVIQIDWPDLAILDYSTLSKPRLIHAPKTVKIPADKIIKLKQLIAKPYLAFPAAYENNNFLKLCACKNHCRAELGPQTETERL